MHDLEQLRVEIEMAREERDKALTSMAQARAELDALRQALRRRGEVEPSLYPEMADFAEYPLRYVLVDEVNERFKRLARPVHKVLRRWLSS